VKRVWKIILSAAIALALIAAVVGLLSKRGILKIAHDEGRASLTQEQTTPSPEPAGAAEAPTVIPSIIISEVMSSNKATLAFDGQFPDWIELYNSGSESAVLSDVVLRCGDKTAQLPAREIAAGEYAVVAVGGGAPDEELMKLALSKDGCTVELLALDGTVFDSVDIPAGETDQSFVRGEDGTVTVSDWPSPGFANSGTGYDSRQETLIGSAPLQINEVMVYNEWNKLGQSDCFDWVEIKNTGEDAIDLSSFYLSDSFKQLQAFQLPAIDLEPGGLILIFCTGQDAAANDRQAAFALNAQRDRLYLSSEDGTILDYVPLRRIPYGGSFGRIDDRGGFFFFETPTPGEANGRGERRVAESPAALTPDGIYNDVESVRVELAAGGEIHYTTDGSVPTQDSPLYTGPLTIGSTCVVRTVNFEEGCVPSDPLNLSFIVNENHTLPVVSVIGDPTDLMGRRGVYYDLEHELETAGAVEFFEDDGSFSIECGIKLHGMTSKRASGKKSLKLCFRSRYDGELNYDLFGNGVTSFASILLRSDIESNLPSLMRDNLMHQVAIDCFPEMPTLDHRYAVLYINGQYWGLYSIREAHSAAHYANHYGYDVDSVTVWRGLWDPRSETAKVCNYVLYHDMRDDENYNYAAEHLNIDSIIGWCVIEGWSSNFDSSPGNIRYYYSSEDDMMRYGLSDLDLGMFAYPVFEVPLNGASENGVLHTYAYNVVPRRLMYNRQFQLEMARQLSEALHGDMSDESILALIDRYHDELLPEMGRNMLRWFKVMDADYGIFLWEKKVDELRTYVTQYGGRSKMVVASFKRFATELSDEEFALYFGDLA
jgi:hypothetical protein